ncbi:MAG: hypothetical protein Q9160_001937 [Pyrenula sp. 1 TL-2023]
MGSTDVDLEAWASRLENSTVTPLTRDYPEATSVHDAATKRPIEALEDIVASSAEREALGALSISSYAPLTVLLTAYAILVSRLTGDEDISIGVNVDSRPFVLRLPLTPADRFSSMLSLIHSQLEEVKTTGNKRPSLKAIRERLSTAVLFRFAVFDGDATSSRTFGDAIETTDLVLRILCEDGQHARLSGFYNQRLFASARIQTVLAQVFCLVSAAAGNPEESVGRLTLMTAPQQKLLPDPTCDLGWSSFRGAIHDIFARNAETHPERTCVVETKSRTSVERSFTYLQIHEASNVLAHHLVCSGIQRGEVVMIYAHRGVDLVVAVMGVLKAGATFSVIDPAYPPDRQNIYLEVAQPRGLVIIKKASEEAGELSETVRSFISTNLDLRAEVPALALEEDGTLLGGTIKGNDVLSDCLKLKANAPRVVVGPDSTPTLSFTSGSEGKPKGVRGRHFSLAYYFDWMSERFCLSADDKFTMLSGIAHDPIQRDIFTPLFLGAQLLVPHKDDIQNEKLAEWMKAYGATVTHLTPAMGQILVGGASAQFDRLHHAFFVGDILIKRDCRQLQSLAPNVFIVNMYGTTETQRAVSYYEIPSFRGKEGFLDSLKDVIPAGKGELGEIYVRAGGLAEGYLRADDLTKTKFVQNWFADTTYWLEEDKKAVAALPQAQAWRECYLGPRDRLYRSGDLGRYTPSGDVECSGRADDQVKIRGFRIELGEIDTHLSQHPLVRENVTLVRRDRNEEQTLVSYVIPQQDKWKAWLKQRGIAEEEGDDTLASRYARFEPLRKDVQDALKKKLPVYAIPSIIFPLSRMPLNPNGKIDKPKLPFPDNVAYFMTKRRKSSTFSALSETEQALGSIWQDLIPGVIARTLKPEDSFLDLGGTSMHAQQLPFRVRRRWTTGEDLITITQIFGNPSLQAMASRIDRALARDSDEAVLDETAADGSAEITETDYASDAKTLEETLPLQIPSVQRSLDQSGQLTVFLTGATGFLGCFILRDLLSRTSPKINAQLLVRAKTAEAALIRIRATCMAYGVWSEEWSSRTTCIVGNLGEKSLGMSDESWDLVSREADVVIHNGAQVHWVHSYDYLKPANVQGTIDAIRLCATGKAKQLAFVSSTSVLDHSFYVRESERIIAEGGQGVSETDDLQGSKQGLGTGYGQSKWVSEYLVKAVGKRGLTGSIIRPGYVTGDSKSGATNIDDFLIRMLKGCIQLHSRPNINNTVNMVPVDHVARVVVACALQTPSPNSLISVAHVTSHPRLTFNEFLATLQAYGYDAERVDYNPWTDKLRSHVANADQGSFALMPLHTFVSNDLPSNTRAPELDDANARAALKADAALTKEDVSEGCGVEEETVGLYLAFLVAIGHVPPPEGTLVAQAKKALPSLKISEEQVKALESVGGRGRNI